MSEKESIKNDAIDRVLNWFLFIAIIASIVVCIAFCAVLTLALMYVIFLLCNGVVELLGGLFGWQ